MRRIDEIIGQFDPISFEEMRSLRASMDLLKRYDTKFVFPSSKLPPLLASLRPYYRVLAAGSKRIFEYENLYFDTDDYLFYKQHHRRKFKRYKLRYRRYVTSQSSFWEVKVKLSKNKTIKERFERPSVETALTDEIRSATQDVFADNFHIDFDNVGPKFWIMFSRLTLANSGLQERITIDTDIRYRDLKGRELVLEGIAVAELKQRKVALRSPFVKVAKEEKIYPMPFSKYCTGVILLNRFVKMGRFKRRMLQLKKLSDGLIQFG